MSGPERQARRAMQSAPAWRRLRMIERRVARLVADRAADPAVQPIRLTAAEPPPMLDAVRRTGLLNTRHVVPAPESPLDRPNGSSWIV